MTERLSNLGYLGMVKEVTPGTPLTPTDYIPLYEETIMTDGQFQDLQPAYGGKFNTLTTIPGSRTFKGNITCMAEANTAARIFNAFLTQSAAIITYTFTVTSANATIGATYTNNGVTFTVTATIAAQTTLVTTAAAAPTASGTLTKASGTGDATITFSAAVATPTTWPYTLTTATPNSYTYDVSLGNIVKRYWGVGVSDIQPNFNNNEMQFKLAVSALGSFEGREIVSVTGSGPYTVTLADTQGVFDQNPTKGLVVGDLIRFHHTGSADIDATVATIVSGTQFTTVTNVSSMVSGDGVHLRPATPSFNNVQPFMWDKTRVGFGTTAANALAATHTPVEIGSGWELIHSFNDDGGEDRSGAFNPAALVRTTGDAKVNIKKICDTPEDEIGYNNLAKSAVVFRHFAGSTNQYELRITINHTKMDTPIGSVKVAGLIYVTQNLHTNFDTSDNQAFDAKVINALTTV